MHGGLSPELKSLEQIKRVARPTDVPDSGLLCDLLWADPDKDIQVSSCCSLQRASSGAAAVMLVCGSSGVAVWAFRSAAAACRNSGSGLGLQSCGMSAAAALLTATAAVGVAMAVMEGKAAVQEQLRDQLVLPGSISLQEQNMLGKQHATGMQLACCTSVGSICAVSAAFGRLSLPWSAVSHISYS
jgi:hypothetical protein